MNEAVVEQDEEENGVLGPASDASQVSRPHRLASEGSFLVHRSSGGNHPAAVARAGSSRSMLSPRRETAAGEDRSPAFNLQSTLRLPSSLRPLPLLTLRETGVIPVENAADGSGFVLGSVQDVSDSAGYSCYMLRWRAPTSVELGAMKNQVKETLL